MLGKKKKRILIVEDDRHFSRMITFLLEGEGYKVVVAHNGTDAFVEINRKPPDLLILDLNLPDIDGFKICSAVKARSATKDVPVIMLTARDKIGQIEEGFDLGAIEYFVKPADDEKLLEAVRKYI